MNTKQTTALLSLLILFGCGGDAGGSGADVPRSFSLAWSEYPSWSVFGVAHERGLIDKAEGKMGEVEKAWNVDIVLKQADYDTCLTHYGSATVDAACLTNMDALQPSNSRPSVAILPTSTSVGADACIVVGIADLDALKGKPTYGLEKSVSEYAFERGLEKAGKDPKDYPFKNMDPAAAAQAMQTKQANIESIMVWNPFVMQTLRTRSDAKVLFDSAAIPAEIIDMVVVARDSLAKPGGSDFACALIDAFYRVNAMMSDPATADETMVALGAKFSNLGLEDMKTVVTQTQFYKTPAEGLALFADGTFVGKTMPMVLDFCASHGIVESKPTVGFGDAEARLNFDGSYMTKVGDRK